MPLRQVSHQVRQLSHHFDHSEKVLMDSLGAPVSVGVGAQNQLSQADRKFLHQTGSEIGMYVILQIKCSNIIKKTEIFFSGSFRVVYLKIFAYFPSFPKQQQILNI